MPRNSALFRAILRNYSEAAHPPHQAFRNDVLACLTEIGSLDIGTIYESLTGELGAAYDTHFEALFTEVRIGPRPPSRPWTDPETTPRHTCVRPR